LVACQGVQQTHADLFGAGGRRFLDELELRADPRARLETLLRLIADFDREIDALAREIDARAKHDPRVDVVCQIYGIGRYLGMLIVAEIGDIERFPTARHLCAWAGLTPTVRSSDAKARLGHISGLGSRALRWALLEAAQKAAQGGGPLRADFERIAKRRGRKIAKVAVARKILTLCFYGLRRRDPLPQTGGPGARVESHRAVVMTAAAHLAAPPARPHTRARSGELVPMSGLPD
jgi:transposase